MICLRKILGIIWQKHIPNTEVLNRVSLPSIYTILMKSQLRWAGHFIRMKDHRLPKKLLYDELSWGKRSQGGQKKRFKDTLKVSPLIALQRIQTSGVELSNKERKSVTQEEMQQLSCAGNFEKALPHQPLPHQPLPPPFLVLTDQDSSAHWLISLAICALTDPVLNHKVDQMVLIVYDG